MRQISSNQLPETTQKYLDDLQSEIVNGTKTDTATNFTAQVNRAAGTWKPKNKHFTIIKDKLQSMTVAGRCNYCECDRACDIEHIYPKSKFPQFAYTWTNYILSCSFCNSYLKIDKFAVFLPKGSAIKIDLKRNSKPVADTDAPPSDDGVLINPRTENPRDFLRLNIIGQTFFYEPIDTDKNSRNYQRADYTRILLDLNQENLRKARESQASFYWNYLNKYIQAKNATNFEDLQKTIDGDFPFLDKKLDFKIEQIRIVENFKIEIQKAMYPTVWDELKRQKEYLPRTNELFKAAPEALAW
jgi:hypothetical protein